MSSSDAISTPHTPTLSQSCVRPVDFVHHEHGPFVLEPIFVLHVASVEIKVSGRPHLLRRESKYAVNGIFQQGSASHDIDCDNSATVVVLSTGRRGHGPDQSASLTDPT